MESNDVVPSPEEEEAKFEEWWPYMTAAAPIVYQIMKKHECAGSSYACKPQDVPIEALRELCVALFRDNTRLCELVMKMQHTPFIFISKAGL